MNIVTEWNAYRYADTYSIIKNGVDDVVAHEHNETEAKALAMYLSNYHGSQYTVRRNSHDEVRKAKEFGAKPIRHQCRDIAFKECGVI